MDIKKFSSESLKELKKQVEDELESRKEEYILYLNVDSCGDLCFGLKGIRNDCFGYIDSDDGTLYVSGDNINWELYEKWVDDGMKVDGTPVKWKDGEYVIKKDDPGEYVLARKAICSGYIFSFETFNSFTHCEDENIKRFRKTPIVY